VFHHAREIHGDEAGPHRMATNVHFAQATSWVEAQELVPFDLLTPDFGLGGPTSISVFVRDHRMRDVPLRERSVEAWFADFVFSQTSREPDEARRLALDVSYGGVARVGSVGPCPATMYDLGPDVPDDDPDGRSPAVVTWHEGEKFYLMASHVLPCADLVRMAATLYGDAGST
jgi:hypothetical protein